MNKENIHIRKLGLADIQQLQSISKETFLDAFGKQNTRSDMQQYLDAAFSIKTLGEELNNRESEFYFAELEKTVAGYLKLNSGDAQADFKDENSIELSRIYILHTFQGKMIGQQLLKKTLEVARAKKVSFIWLGVWEHNPDAIRFYEKNGFVKFSTHHFMLGNDRQTDILMKYILN